MSNDDESAGIGSDDASADYAAGWSLPERNTEPLPLRAILERWRDEGLPGARRFMPGESQAFLDSVELVLRMRPGITLGHFAELVLMAWERIEADADDPVGLALLEVAVAYARDFRVSAL